MLVLAPGAAMRTPAPDGKYASAEKLSGFCFCACASSCGRASAESPESNMNDANSILSFISPPKSRSLRLEQVFYSGNNIVTDARRPQFFGPPGGLSAQQRNPPWKLTGWCP